MKLDREVASDWELSHREHFMPGTWMITLSPWIPTPRNPSVDRGFDGVSSVESFFAR